MLNGNLAVTAQQGDEQQRPVLAFVELEYAVKPFEGAVEYFQAFARLEPGSGVLVLMG